MVLSLFKQVLGQLFEGNEFETLTPPPKLKNAYDNQLIWG